MIMGTSESRVGGWRPSSCSTEFSKAAVAGAEAGVEDVSDGIGSIDLEEEDIVSSVINDEAMVEEETEDLYKFKVRASQNSVLD